MNRLIALLALFLGGCALAPAPKAPPAWLTVPMVGETPHKFGDVSISHLPAGGALTGPEQIPAVQAGVTVTTTPAAIASYSNAHIPAGVPIPSSDLTGTVPGNVVPGIFPAQSYGSCTWTSVGDVGPCINLAIAAACTAGGGDVRVPASGTNSYFGVATQIVQACSGVHLIGEGVGDPRASNPNDHFLSYTRLLWTGASGATMGLVGSTSLSAGSLYSADVRGIVWDCHSVAAICLQVQHVTDSTFDVGAAEPTSIGLLFTTTNSSVGPGTQNNDIWASCRSTTGNPTCIMFDQGPSANWNFSYNRIHNLYVWFNNGDGIVFGGNDNNTVDQVRAFRNPGSTSGREFVVANPGYTSPNGVPVNGTQIKTVLHTLHTGVHVAVMGYQTGSTLTAGGGNTGGAIATTTIATNGTSAAGVFNLKHGSTTGVVPGMAVNCTGGQSAGVEPNDQVVSVISTQVTLLQPLLGSGIANGVNCVYGYGVQQSAVPGTYTITATSSSTFSITAPTGGNTQTGVVYDSVNNTVTFTDLVMQLSAPPVNGDTYTLVVPNAATKVFIDGVDESNGKQKAFFESGATGFTANISQGIPDVFPPSIGSASSATVTATGTTTPRAIADIAADLSRPEANGAPGNGKIVTANVTTTASNCTIVISGAPLTGTSTDKGKFLIIPGANSGGATFVSTISTITNGGGNSTVVVNTPCPTATLATVSSAVIWGSDDQPGAQKALNTGGLLFTKRVYILASQLTAPTDRRVQISCLNGTNIFAATLGMNYMLEVPQSSAFHAMDTSLIGTGCAFQGMALATNIIHNQSHAVWFDNMATNDPTDTAWVLDGNCSDTRMTNISALNGVAFPGLSLLPLHLYHNGGAGPTGCSDNHVSHFVGAGFTDIGWWTDLGAGALECEDIHLFRGGNAPMFKFSAGSNFCKGLYPDNIAQPGGNIGIDVNSNNNMLWTGTVKANVSYVDAIGVQIENGKLGNIIGALSFQNFDTGSGPANAVVQVGSAGSPANIVCFNNGGTYTVCPNTSRGVLQINSGNGVATGLTDYLIPGVVGTSTATYALLPGPGTLKNLYIHAQTTPSAAQSYVVTVYAGPAGSMSSTTITCTIAAGGNSCNDLTHTAATTAGQSYAVQLANSSTGGTGNLAITLEFDN